MALLSLVLPASCSRMSCGRSETKGPADPAPLDEPQEAEPVVTPEEDEEVAAPQAAMQGAGGPLPGLDYREIRAGGSTLHILEVDLERFRLRVADARTGLRKRATVRQLAREMDAVAVINGTFFLPDFKPLGLLIDEGRTLNPLRKADWGVLYFIPARGMDLVHTSTWKKIPEATKSEVSFALQVGPRVVEKGRPLSLKRQSAARAAVCIRSPYRVVLVLSRGLPLESNLLASTLARSPDHDGLGCSEALMLDGGPSAQLYVRAGGLTLDLPGGWPVPNGIAVVRK